ncbi:fimbrial protein [Pantoea sp. B65]
MLLISEVYASAVAVNFSGTLIEPPACTINHGQRIDVDFGDNVGAHLVDGQNYRRTIDYQLACPAAAPPLVLTLMMTGGVTEFDAAAINTNIADLGIQLLHDGIPLTLNMPIALDMTRPPLLQAVPVKRAGASLARGRFAATATLHAGYW